MAMFSILGGDHPALGTVTCASGHSDIYRQVCLPAAGEMALMRGRYFSVALCGRGPQSAV